MPDELVLIDRARAALEKARTVCEAAEVRDQALAVSRYLKRKEGAEEACRHANEIRLRAERRIGELDAKQPPGPQSSSHDRTNSTDLTRQERDRYRRVAAVPEAEFEAALQEPEPTTAGLVRIANQHSRTEKRAEKREAVATVAKATGRYAVIYADPPWEYDYTPTEKRAIENQYPTMPLDRICALPVPDLALDDCVLFLWATSPKLTEALSVLDAWGFAYRTCAVWDKQKIGMGYYFRQQHEILLVGAKGSLPVPDPAARVSSVISAKRGKHSAKPGEVYEILEAMYPSLPRIELFARNEREGWASWGTDV